MPPNGLGSARKLARLSAELLRYRSVRAPSIAVKALLARALYGVDITRFLMVGMYAQRMSRWTDSMSYLVDLEPGLQTLNWDGDGKRLTVDKLATAERLVACGLPAAPLIGVVGRDTKVHPHAGTFASLHGAHELVAALAAAPDALFVKPAMGWRGDGIFGPERRGAHWRLNERALTDLELAERLLSTAPPGGWLIQERLRSHRALAPVGGHLGLGTVRINTALTDSGPEVIFVFGKLMGSVNLVDNFAGGRFGNMLARIDPRSGRIRRVFGRRRDQRYLMETITHHPVTGTALQDFEMPLWQEAVALAKRAALAFPESPLLGADMALTDAGPVIIEMQSDWDSNAPQLILAQGLRPLLRELVPRLAARREIRERAFLQMGLDARARRRPTVLREARA